MTHKNCGGKVIETRMNNREELINYCLTCHNAGISYQEGEAEYSKGLTPEEIEE